MPIPMTKANTDTDAKNMRAIFFTLWAALLLIKLWIASHLQLFGDEAFYWLESQNLAWAYSDLPGMNAWLIAIGTAILGDTELGVRSVFILIGAALPLLAVRSCLRWFSAEQSWFAGTLILALPLSTLSGFLALPEIVLALSFLLALDALTQWRRQLPWVATLQLGLALTVGALCHYRFAPLLFALVLGFALSAGWRSLFNRRILLAGTLGALAWLPLVVFNAQMHNSGLQFQLVDRHPWSFDPAGLLQPIAQALISTPVIYALALTVLWCLYRNTNRQFPGKIVLFACLLPIAVYAALASFVDQIRTSFHWTYSVMPALLVFAPLVIGESAHPRRWRRLAHGFAWPLHALAIVWFLWAASPQWSPIDGRSKLYPNNFVGWRELGEAVEAELKSDELIVADNFMTLAQLRFGVHKQADMLSMDHPMNHKHGRAVQLTIWGMGQSQISSGHNGQKVMIVLEPLATKPGAWNGFIRQICAQFDSLHFVRKVSDSKNASRFLILRGTVGRSATEQCADFEDQLRAISNRSQD